MCRLALLLTLLLPLLAPRLQASDAPGPEQALSAAAGFVQEKGYQIGSAVWQDGEWVFQTLRGPEAFTVTASSDGSKWSLKTKPAADFPAFPDGNHLKLPIIAAGQEAGGLQPTAAHYADGVWTVTGVNGLQSITVRISAQTGDLLEE